MCFVLYYLPQTCSRFTCLDILNTLNPPRVSKDNNLQQEQPYVPPDPRKQMENARLLSKYVFPRQYGLASVFTLDPRIIQMQQMPTYADRTEEIKACRFLSPSVFFSHIHSRSSEERTVQNANPGETCSLVTGADDLEKRKV